MTTPTPLTASFWTATDHEASRFAGQWLRGSRHLAVRSAPVIAVVQELATVLRDEQIPAAQALLVLRRAIRLLRVLTAGTGDDSRREVDADAPDWVPDIDDVTQSVQSMRFAATWLHGNPAEAIRTEPVIAIVEGLLSDMVYVKAPHSAVYASLRRAVRVLSVLAREDQPATPGSDLTR